MTFNLVDEKWIPVLRKDGRKDAAAKGKKKATGRGSRELRRSP